MNHALKLIKEDELNLKEIAKACGFNTHRTLIRVFHQRFGLPPSKWAKERKKELKEEGVKGGD
jgi:AraC-like DNA-binding protein